MIKNELNGKFVTKEDLLYLPSNVSFFAGKIREGHSKIEVGNYLANGNEEDDFEFALRESAEMALMWANDKLFYYESSSCDPEFIIEGRQDGWYDCNGDLIYSFEEFPRTVEEFVKKGSTSHHYDVYSYGIVAKWEEDD